MLVMELDKRFTACRLCLCPSENLVGVFDCCDGYIPAEMITELMRFEVSVGDIYPQCVCGSCLRKLTDFKKFKELCCIFKASIDRAYSTQLVNANRKPPFVVGHSPVPCHIEKLAPLERTVKQEQPESSHEQPIPNAGEVIVPDDFNAPPLDAGAVVKVNSRETSRVKDEAVIAIGIHSSLSEQPECSHEQPIPNAGEVIVPDDFNAPPLDAGAVVKVNSRETSHAKEDAVTAFGIHSSSTARAEHHPDVSRVENAEIEDLTDSKPAVKDLQVSGEKGEIDSEKMLLTINDASRRLNSMEYGNAEHPLELQEEQRVSSHEQPIPNAGEVIVPDDFNALPLDAGAVVKVNSRETSRVKDEAVIAIGIHSSLSEQPECSHEQPIPNAGEVIVPDDFNAPPLDAGAVVKVNSRETSHAKEDAVTAFGIHSSSTAPAEPLYHPDVSRVENAEIEDLTDSKPAVKDLQVSGEKGEIDSEKMLLTSNDASRRLNSMEYGNAEHPLELQEGQPMFSHEKALPNANEEVIVPDDISVIPSIPEEDKNDVRNAVDGRKNILVPQNLVTGILNEENSEGAASPDICRVEHAEVEDPAGQKATEEDLPPVNELEEKNDEQTRSKSVPVAKESSAQPIDEAQELRRRGQRENSKASVYVMNSNVEVENAFLGKNMVIEELTAVIAATRFDADTEGDDANDPVDDLDDSGSDFQPDMNDSDSSDEEFMPSSSKRSKVCLSQSDVPGTSGISRPHENSKQSFGVQQIPESSPRVVKISGETSKGPSVDWVAGSYSVLKQLLALRPSDKLPYGQSAVKNDGKTFAGKNPNGYTVSGMGRHLQSMPSGSASCSTSHEPSGVKQSAVPSSVEADKETNARAAKKKKNEAKERDAFEREEEDISSSSSSSSSSESEETDEDERMDEEIQKPKSSEKGVFDCSLCGKRYFQGRTFRYHMEAHENGNCFKCETCGKAFSRECYLKEHFAVHVTERNFPCDVCGKAFKSKPILYCHKRTHGEKKYICELCGKKYLTLTHLKDHLTNHNKEKYPCEMCGKRFFDKKYVNRHIKCVHLNQRKFDHCCSVCGKKYGSPTTLKIHERTHTGERPFKCSVCGKVFRTNAELNIHMNFHTKEKSYKCEICEAVLSCANSLYRHRKRHSGESKYKCDKCGKEYTQSHNLKNHQKKHHTDKFMSK